MTSLRVALRLSLMEHSSMPVAPSKIKKKKERKDIDDRERKAKIHVPTTADKQPQKQSLNLNTQNMDTSIEIEEPVEEVDKSQKTSRGMKDKRKLELSPEPRRNQRRGNSNEINEEECNLEALKSLATMIQNGKRVVIVTGAGLSCASGIPAFRSSKPMDDGTIWGKHVESMGTRSAFLKDPLHWYNSFWLQSFAPVHMDKRPSNGHEALSELISMFPKISVITQNVDGLQQCTSTSWDHKSRLIEAHGRVGLYRCSSVCDYSEEKEEQENEVKKTENLEETDIGETRGRITEEPGKAEELLKTEEQNSSSNNQDCPFSEDEVIVPTLFSEDEQNQLGHTTHSIKMTKVPLCPHCKEPCLPLALLFDEDYTDHEFYQFEKLQEWFDEAEVFMFVGTSFSVTLTSLALQVARSKRIPMFNFNIEKDVDKAATKTLTWKNITGKAEELLPRLLHMVKNNGQEGSS